jgi:hypothetical protein
MAVVFPAPCNSHNTFDLTTHPQDDEWPSPDLQKGFHALLDFHWPLQWQLQYIFAERHGF